MANQIQSCFRRYEKKYRLTAAQQRFLLEGMAPYMKKDAYGAYTICNIYYDTGDWRLIRKSLEKPVYKEKLRITFDTSLRWRDTQLDLRLGDHGAPIDDPDMILMEVKIPGVCPL